MGQAGMTHKSQLWRAFSQEALTREGAFLWPLEKGSTFKMVFNRPGRLQHLSCNKSMFTSTYKMANFIRRRSRIYCCNKMPLSSRKRPFIWQLRLGREADWINYTTLNKTIFDTRVGLLKGLDVVVRVYFILLGVYNDFYWYSVK